MNPQKIVRQADALRFCVYRHQATTLKKFLGSLIRILGALFVSTFLISCLSTPPKYEAYPTLSMKDRLEGPGKDSKNPFNWWTKGFNREHGRMATNEWPPSADLLNQTFSQAAEEYGASRSMPDLALVKEAFTDKFKFEEDDPNCNGVMKGVVSMVHLVDIEHPNLLINSSRLKMAPEVDRYGLLSLVSAGDPVSVALTRWATAAPPENKPGGPNIVIIGNTVVTPSELSRLLAPEDKASDGKQAGAKKEDGAKEKDEKQQTEPKKKANPGGDFEKQTKPKTDPGNTKEGGSEQTKEKPVPVEDFKPEQHVTLSLSTVLNSPVVFDRIEYVSTYLYMQAFPFPPNGDVVLEKEFWRRFFALNTSRNSLNEKIDLSDMRRAIEDMRVRITNADTTVKLQEIDFGSLTRKTSDKFTAEVAATAVVPPTLTSITPKLGYSTGVDTEASLKLQQQLDQRSTYVDPHGHFLRITQRGMQSVNLAGRFVENLTLWIPTAQDQIPALAPVQDSATKAVKQQVKQTQALQYRVKWFSQPLYSRVDALTLSVVVARQATALAKSTKDSFRLDDPRDAVFIAGVTQPYRITLWQNERQMCEVMLAEIFGNDSDLSKNQKVFFTTFEKERPAPLRLYGFTPEQQHELLRKIQKLAIDNQYGVVSLPMDGDTKITIGLPDSQNPAKLVGFKKKS